jgi:hypothetical protein
MKYAIVDSDGHVLSVFEADNFICAIQTKHDVEQAAGHAVSSRPVFHVREATRRDIKQFERAGVAGFVVRRSRS